MAGAPSSRGCEACRKQKKKCDQAKPACSRCTRLKIECVGIGQRRFIFKQGHREGSSASNSRSPPERCAMAVSQTPSDDISRRSSAFITLLEVTDVRYALSCYGELLIDLPKRLGRNPGLDAAVNAMTISYAGYRNGKRSSEATSSYLNAIQALKSCFHDPSVALAPETLCAMYLCMICQNWLAEVDEPKTHHGEAMAQIMTAALRRPWLPGFEAEVLTVMCVPVIFESLFNPRINLEPWIWRLIEMYEPIRTPGPRLAAPFESLHLQSLAKFAVFTRSPRLHILEIQSSYQQICRDLPELYKGLEKVSTATIALCSMSSNEQSVHGATKALVRIQTAYSLLLALATIFNHFLRRCTPDHVALHKELEAYCDEIIRVAQEASRHRPFGSSTQPFSLITAWVTSDNAATRSQTERLIMDYQSDFPATNWMAMAAELQQKLMV